MTSVSDLVIQHLAAECTEREATAVNDLVGIEAYRMVAHEAIHVAHRLNAELLVAHGTIAALREELRRYVIRQVTGRAA